MGCGGSTPVGSSAVSETHTTATDTRMIPSTATATTTMATAASTPSSQTAIEGTPIDYELDGEEMDMVELVRCGRLFSLCVCQNRYTSASVTHNCYCCFSASLVQALFIAKTKREEIWIRSVNAVNLDGERDKFITALGNCINIESLE